MRVNIYAEEMTDRIEIISKEIDGQTFTGLRLYLYLPVTASDGVTKYRGPFIHRPGDDDSSAVTFWGKQDLRETLRIAIDMLDNHYGDNSTNWAEDILIKWGKVNRLKYNVVVGEMKDMVEINKQETDIYHEMFRWFEAYEEREK